MPEHLPARKVGHWKHLDETALFMMGFGLLLELIWTESCFFYPYLYTLSLQIGSYPYLAICRRFSRQHPMSPVEQAAVNIMMPIQYSSRITSRDFLYRLLDSPVQYIGVWGGKYPDWEIGPPTPQFLGIRKPGRLIKLLEYCGEYSWVSSFPPRLELLLKL